MTNDTKPFLTDEFVELIKELIKDIEANLDESIEGDTVITPSSGNVFADLGLENAEELKAMADKMIAKGIPEDQIVSALKELEQKKTTKEALEELARLDQEAGLI